MKRTLTHVYLRTATPMLLGPLVAMFSILATHTVREVYVARADEVTLTAYYLPLTIGLLCVGSTLLFSQLPSWRITLLHRGISAPRHFDAAVQATLGMSALATLLGVILPSFFVWLLRKDGPLVTPRGVAELLTIGTSVFAGAGLAAWISSLRGSWLGIGLRALAATAAVCAIGNLLLTPPRGAFAAPFAPAIGFNLLVLMVGLATGRKQHLTANDRDRPLDPDSLRLAAPSAAATCAACFALVIPYAQQELVKTWLDYPLVVRARDRAAVELVVPTSDGEYRRVDRDHVEFGERITNDDLGDVAFDPRYGAASRLDGELGRDFRRSSRDFAFGTSWNAVAFSAFANAYLIRETGELIVARHSHPSAARGRAWERGGISYVLRPDGAAFSARADVLGVVASIGATELDGAGAVILGDPADGSLHRLELGDFTSPRLHRIEIPNGDRYVRWHSLARPFGSDDPDARVDLDGHLDAFVVVGERGRYVIQRDFRLVEADHLELGTWPPAAYGSDAAIEQTGDALRFSVSLVDAEGVESFRHDYEPRTPREKFVAGALGLFALGRSPLLLAIGFATPPRPGKLYVADHFFDPRVRGGAGAAWLALALVVAASLAIRARRLLHRHGADPSRWWIWAICSFAFGPATWLAFRTIETNRAYAPEPEAERPRARCLVAVG